MKKDLWINEVMENLLDCLDVDNHFFTLVDLSSTLCFLDAPSGHRMVRKNSNETEENHKDTGLDCYVPLPRSSLSLKGHRICKTPAYDFNLKIS